MSNINSGTRKYIVSWFKIRENGMITGPHSRTFKDYSESCDFVERLAQDASVQSLERKTIERFAEGTTQNTSGTPISPRE